MRGNPVEGHTRCMQILHECNYDTEEALSILRLKPFAPRKRPWSTKDRAAFKTAIYQHGKQFKKIATTVGGNRTVGEIVNHYFGEWRYSQGHRQYQEYCRKQKSNTLALLSTKEDDSFAIRGKVSPGTNAEGCVMEGIWAHTSAELGKGKVGKFRYRHVGGWEAKSSVSSGKPLGNGANKQNKVAKPEEVPKETETRRSGRGASTSSIKAPEDVSQNSIAKAVVTKPKGVADLAQASWPPTGRYVGYFVLGTERATKIEEKIVHITWTTCGQMEVIGNNSLCGIFGVKATFDYKMAKGNKGVCEVTGRKWYMSEVPDGKLEFGASAKHAIC